MVEQFSRRGIGVDSAASVRTSLLIIGRPMSWVVKQCLQDSADRSQAGQLRRRDVCPFYQERMRLQCLREVASIRDEEAEQRAKLRGCECLRRVRIFQLVDRRRPREAGGLTFTSNIGTG